MCLGPEFFDNRDLAIKTREAAGEIEVEHFMRSKRLRFGLLVDLGYLDDFQECVTTVDFFVYRVPEEASAFLSADTDHQLIFVRAEQVATLAKRLRKRVPASIPEL